MGFFIAGHFSPMGIRDWFSIQGSFKTFLDKTLLALLDFFSGYVIR